MAELDEPERIDEATVLGWRREAIQTAEAKRDERLATYRCLRFCALILWGFALVSLFQSEFAFAMFLVSIGGLFLYVGCHYKNAAKWRVDTDTDAHFTACVIRECLTRGRPIFYNVETENGPRAGSRQPSQGSANVSNDPQS